MSRWQALLVDVDGTLVDSVYNHVEAWFRAFQESGFSIPKFKIHKLIGMGADLLISKACESQLEAGVQKRIDDLHDTFYRDQINLVKLLPFAREFLAQASNKGLKVILVSSAKQYEINHYLKMLQDNFLYISSAEVSKSKPDPEIYEAALRKGNLSADEALVIGDSIWDLEASAKINLESIAVLTGGFCRQELVSAGAARVYKGLREAQEVLESH